ETSVLISRIDDITTGAGETVLIPFTIGHVSIDPSLLNVTAVADNNALIAPDSFEFSGDGTQRSIAITPLADETGVAQITLTVSDGTESISEMFLLTVE